MLDPLGTIESEIDSFNSWGISQAKQGMAVFLKSLVRPMATLTEVIYRQELGERYFTRWNGTVGVVLLTLATLPRSFYSRSWNRGFPVFSTTGWQTADWITLGVGVVWLLLFASAWGRHQKTLRNRYNQGIMWHSYCRGVCPLDDRIPITKHGLILALFGGGAMWLGIWGPGILLVISGYVSMQLRGIEQALMHNQILNAIDKRIESENLSQAVMRFSNPKSTEGFSAPLPAYVSDKFREKFAQTVKRRTASSQQAQDAVAVPMSAG
jgi:hypothetical protein